MTLNQKTGEKEWQKPLEKQEFEHNEEMYSVKTIDSEGKEGELVVSPEHKVYVNYKSKNFLTSLSSNTLTKDCFFNFDSLDQIGVLSNVNDKANNGVSFKCGHISSAFVNDLSYSDFGIDLINVENSVKKKYDDSSLLRLDFSDISDKLFLISSNTNSGTHSFIPLLYNSKIRSNTSPLGLLINPAISTLVSNISIFYKPCFLATPSLILLDNSLASFSDNLDFEAIDLSSCFCNSTLAHCSNDLSNSSLVRKVLTNLSASSAYSSGICNLKLNSCILTNNNDKSNLNSFRLEKDISSLMQDKVRDLDSSERDFIDDEGSDDKRVGSNVKQDETRSQDVLILSATNINKELNILIN